MDRIDVISQIINDSIDVKTRILSDNDLLRRIAEAADSIVTSLENDGKLVICGNGGSASDAIHFASEIVGRFQKNREAWPAITLNSDVAAMTAISNDYGFDEIFARQAEAHINKNDVFVGISTSGNSTNVLRAMSVAREKGAVTIAFTGKDGGQMLLNSDIPLLIPSNVTARIQEAHIILIHIICEIVEDKLSV